VTGGLVVAGGVEDEPSWGVHAFDDGKAGPGGRPAGAVIWGSIEVFKAVFGVYPICRALTARGIA
jgi:hypothetical protein